MPIGSVEIDLPAGGDFSQTPTGDLVLAQDLYGAPAATTERLIRLILTNPRLLDGAGNPISAPEDAFNVTYGAGCRALVGEPISNALISQLAARINAALLADPSVASVQSVTVQQTGPTTVAVSLACTAVSGQIVTIPSLPLPLGS